jgi:Rieske Fe-S protein
VVAIVAPIIVFLYPPQGQASKKDTTIKLNKAPGTLANGDAEKFEAPPDTGFIMRDGGGDNAAGKVAFAGYLAKDLTGAVHVFAVNCSHLGCSVAYDAGVLRFQCPCHGSQFNVNGQVVHGPAIYPLSNLSWRPGANPDEIVVSSYALKGVG